MSGFLISKGESSAEFIVKKSRFLARVFPVQSRDEIKEILTRTAREHPGARHIVHAFVLGSKGELAGMSDDGEPHGTAGHPILDLLQGRKLTDTMAVVVRYFGGIKLGTGGLVSAYSESVRLALETLPVGERIELSSFSLSLSYPLYTEVQRILPLRDAVVEREVFGTGVEVDISVPSKNKELLKEDLLNLSRGSILLF